MVNLRCVICNTAFENAQKVKEHITTHLSGLPYPCDKCDYSFETQDQLEEHEVKHAEMEYEEQIEKELTEEEMQKRAEEEAAEYLDDDDDIEEFMITTDLENTELIRRSKRVTKIKNYAEFLKEELGSDVEEVQDDDTSEDVVIPTAKSAPVEEDILKPIVRTGGTKVYSRKTSVNRVKPVILNPAAHVKQAAPEQINEPEQITSLESLTLDNKAIQALGDKQFVDLKMGDKMVRVQKLVLTQAEVEAMAKEGRLEKKGNALLLKKTMLPQKAGTKQASIESIIEEASKSSPSKTPLKKTYQRPKEAKESAKDLNASTSSGNTDEVHEEFQ